MRPNFDEEAIPFRGDPQEYVQVLAEGKALSLGMLYPDAIILSADTIVYKEGRIYGKPSDEKAAFESIHLLQGGWHSVYSGVAIFHEGKILRDVDETKVLFNQLTPLQIKRHLNALHWADKAGGYAIQCTGSLIVKQIIGCYYNVIGLPIQVVNNLLNKIGIDLWDHLRTSLHTDRGVKTGSKS